MALAAPQWKLAFIAVSWRLPGELQLAAFDGLGPQGELTRIGGSHGHRAGLDPGQDGCLRITR